MLGGERPPVAVGQLRRLEGANREELHYQVPGQRFVALESLGGDVAEQLLWETGNLQLLWEGNELLWEGNEGNCWCDTGEERTARLEIGENRGAGDALLVSRLLIDVGDSRWFLLELGDARAARLVGDARAARLEVRGARLRLLLRALRVSLGGSTWEIQL